MVCRVVLASLTLNVIGMIVIVIESGSVCLCTSIRYDRTSASLDKEDIRELNLN
jgi:hypothetical protein